MKHSSHRSEFQTKQLSVDQQGENLNLFQNLDMNPGCMDCFKNDWVLPTKYCFVTFLKGVFSNRDRMSCCTQKHSGAENLFQHCTALRMCPYYAILKFPNFVLVVKTPQFSFNIHCSIIIFPPLSRMVCSRIQSL